MSAMELDGAPPTTNESDDDEEQFVAAREFTAAEREEAERLHRTAVRAEALAAAQSAAKERGVALSNEEKDKIVEAKAAKPKFLSKAEREAAALARLEAKRAERDAAAAAAARDRKKGARGRFSAPPPPRDPGGAADAARLPRVPQYEEADEPLYPTKKPRKDIHGRAPAPAPAAVPASVAEARNTEKELRLIRENYLGKGPKQKKVVKPSEKFARIFQFDWDANDDTSADLNPLYARRHAVQPLLGRGYVAGLDMREQRKTQTFASVLSDKRMAEARRQEEDEGLARAERKRREDARKEERERLRRDMAAETEKVEKAALGRELLHWTDKALGDMTDRDWRIMKEDFDIRIRGGKAPLPLRFWGEADLGEPLLMAIRDAGYKEPSPIQRQAIPVGLELRDIIGVAETGSGKTAAFCIPMIRYISRLPAARIASLADDGPLALVMAPTRELATQIAGECKKLTAHMDMNVTTVVGGMSIEDQAFVLREGVEIIVGTPGRIQDCLDTQYLVLNQANYVVLDEADRMIDMGFEPQVHSILEEMGGLLLSEDDIEMEQQRLAVQRGEACYRITAMFSATMPSAVEKLAKKFLRHPAIVCIGDEDSGKNKRIAQHVLYVAEAAKKNAVVDILRKKKAQDKYLVFCNEKKGCDALAKVLSTAGLRSSVLHGGKTQEHRDATLAAYKAGSVTVLVATDVAGRGLDIPDVAHVVNYDMPLKIENYSHRIGRTGRAGKDGVATTLLTDSDEAMMYDLRQYLEQTDAQIPERLEKNPAAHAKPGERNDRGELLTNRLGRNKTEFLREDKFAQG